jgi:hypothetical protein
MGKAENKSATPTGRYIDFPMQFEVATEKATYTFACTFRAEAGAMHLLPGYREQMLTMPWVSPRQRDALKVLASGSVREFDRRVKHNEAAALRRRVTEVETRLRENGERLNGIRDAALNEVAQQQGLPSGEALKKKLQRYK